MRIVDGGALDSLVVYDLANTTQLALGTVALGGDYAQAPYVHMEASMTRSGNAIVLTLGRFMSGSKNVMVAAATMVWTPSSSATDASGNPVATSPVTETGAPDQDF